MNEARQIELLAKLAYRLVLNVGRNASETLKNSIGSAIQQQADNMTEYDRNSMRKAEITLRLMHNMVLRAADGGVDTAFGEIQNKPALRPILFMADVFARAAQDVDIETFKKLIPGQAAEEETAEALDAHSGAFPDLIKALV